MTAEAENPLSCAISRCKALHILPRDDVASTVISPAMAASDEVAIMMGFFSSASFAQIAPGLATFLGKSTQSLRLVISPFISAQDQEAFRLGTLEPDALASRAVDSLMPREDELAKHTVKCLAWLISSGRLQVRIALMRDALFHSKVWIFGNNGVAAALHGSANMTGNGLGRNREQLSLARSWKSSEGEETCTELTIEFEALWAGGDADCVTLGLSEALASKVMREFKGEKQPTEEDFERLWRRAHGLSDQPVDIGELMAAEKGRKFRIPEWLEYRRGNYAHQGEAIDAWTEQGHQGILEMCTGSGKTLTSLTGAKLLYDKVGPLLIVVSAPYNVLVSQWCSEIELFGLRPINMSQAGGKAGRSSELASARRRLKKGVSDCEAIVVSNDTLCTVDFQEQIKRFSGPKLLIADECHNLGAANFIENPPDFFDYRLGLSATPIRQYDDEGTDQLFSYFGEPRSDEPCFRYSLEQAIGTCLTPYDYHVRFVRLNSEEMSEWREISEKIAKLSWKIEAGEKDEYLNSLFLSRRRILETAEEKLEALKDIILEVGPRNLEYALIYATDKYPEQLQRVNALLNANGVFFHQLTSDETKNPKKTQALLSRFQSGDFQVLTAKRVLDEGVNVPQIMSAYILASTTVRRQWIQRRGRLLRTCKAIGKEAATIFDLVALPPGVESGTLADSDERRIINGELDRVWEFARLSRNGAETGGPFEAVEKMRAMVGG
mgnify:CR=1 FL=1